MDDETKRKFHMLVGSRIRHARSIKLSQEQLANLINLKRTTITSIEKGHHCITLDTLWSIANVLNIDIVELLPKAEEVNLTFAEIVEKTLTPAEKKWYDVLRKKD